MPFDLNSFSQNITQYGYTNSSKFDVLITNPSFFSGLSGFQTIPQLMQFRAEKVQAPTLMLTSNESNIYGAGPLVKQPYGAAMGDIEITFLADKESIIYNYFYTWMNYIYNFSDLYDNSQASTSGATANVQNYQTANYLTGFEDDYVAPSITINYYDNVGNNYQQINAFRAKPMLLTSSSLDWEAQNQAFRIRVVFNYREWSLTVPSI